MKNTYISICFGALALFFGCKKGSETAGSQENKPITLNTELKNRFNGVYLIGDGEWSITPTERGYLFSSSPMAVPQYLQFTGFEKDSLFVYADSSQTVVIKMDKSHQTGTYYESDEKWPVQYLSPIPKEETEEEEMERIGKQRHLEDSIAYASLGMYSGIYTIETESDGVEATLKLTYNGDQTFKYQWKFNVSAEEAQCHAERKGLLAMDRTQHGFDNEGGCMLHFNFNGFWNGSYVVEIDFEDPKNCPHLHGDCLFSSRYIKTEE